MKNCLVFLLLLVSELGFSQSSSTLAKPMQVKIQSPEANSLGRFGDIPVGKFTGTANISVPICNIQVGNFNLPISLRYHTSGVQVDEVATNVGLGWSLDAGGAISRTIQGLDDFSAQGYINTPYRLPHPFDNAIEYNYSENGGGQPYKNAKKIADGEVDAQPDLYSYNFTGNSGKFYFDMTEQAHPIPFNALKYEHLGNAKFKITDTKGIKYFFTDIESTASAQTCGMSSQATTYLSKILLPNNDSIVFLYNLINYQYETKGNVSIISPVNGNSSIGINLVSQNLDCLGNAAVGQIYVSGLRLHKITTTRGANIEFNYTTNRADLPNTQMLNSIVTKYGNDVIKTHTLFHSYFTNESRLKFDSIMANDEVYRFSYNESINMPDRLGNAKDHYGYYNGKSNSTLLPVDYENGFIDGADREIDPNFIQVGILNKITYPTGGRSEFIYEPNDYRFTGIEKTFAPKSHFLAGIPNGTSTKTFVIPNSPIVILNPIAIFVSAPTQSNFVDSSCTITITGPNGYYNQWTNQTFLTGISLGNLTPGTYTMNISNVGYFNSSYIEVKYQEMYPVSVDKNKFTGGLRIKSILNYTGNSNQLPQKKIFTYTDPITNLSSGKINFTPQYINQILYTVTHELHEDPFDPFIITGYYFTDHLYWKQNDNPFLSLSTIQGNTVGYTIVTETESDILNNGKIVSSFSYEPDFGGSLSTPLVPTISRDWYNGLPLTEIVYKKNNNTFASISSKTNYYSARPESEFWNAHYTPTSYNNTYTNALGINLEYKHIEYLVGLLVYPATFKWNDYHYISKWVRLDSTVSKIFDQNNPSNVLTQSEKYEYSNLYNLQPTKTTTKKSNDKLLETTKKFPNDLISNLSSQANLAKQKLITDNDIDVVLEEKQLVSNVEMQAQRANYEIYSNDTRLKQVEKSILGLPLTTEATVDNYDDKGNITQTTGKDDIVTSYFWGYLKTYPVAKVIGKSYNDALTQSNILLSALNNPISENVLRTELNKLRNLPNTFVTTYTYKPLVGITSETDANNKTKYYEYDSFNRLYLIRDQDNNILKKICYNYAGQVENCPLQ